MNPAAILALPLLLGADPAEPETPPEKALGSETAGTSFLRHGLQDTVRGDGLRLGGDIYIDTGYERSARGLESEPDLEFWLQQGRFKLEANHTTNAGGAFVRAQGQVLAHVDEIRGQENVDTDDAWLMAGCWDAWDVQVGRFEGWEVYHKGQGLERDTLEDLGAFDGPDIYEVNYAFYRQNGFGQAALHAYPFPWLRFELGSVFGNELGFNSFGLRPVGILDGGVVKVKLAAEWRKLTNQEEGKKSEEEKRGFGGSVQVFLDEPGRAVPIQLGVNAAAALVDKIDPFGKVDEKGSTDTVSTGAFANVGLWETSIGLGYNLTIQGDRQRNDQTGRDGRAVHHQLFLSVKQPLWTPAATLKLVFALARADLEPSFENHRVNDMGSVRLRLLYAF